ncbi:uncharacterized protein LOC128244525 [Mya arenaria]|uniref:uncharacterized protein LOC128244525 n=1 Tax=Mya arenaria TaxID=6604 RepID=UPI0022E44968|nr:uncharacterized protein LOC128244525 [Mya arenaria]
MAAQKAEVGEGRAFENPVDMQTFINGIDIIFGFTLSDLRQAQSADNELGYMIEWLMNSSSPTERDLFLASPYRAGLSTDLVIEQMSMCSVETFGGLTRGTQVDEAQRAQRILSRPFATFLPVDKEFQIKPYIDLSCRYSLDIGLRRSTMRGLLVCVVLAIGVATASGLRAKTSKRFLLNNGQGLTSSQESQIKNGFDSAKYIADKIDKADFGGVAGALVGKFSSFLGVLGPFVGLALSLFGGDSPELTLLKRLFTEVENRFDQIDVQFAQLRQQIAFIPTQVHFTDLESNINAVQSELITLSKVTNLAGYKYEAGEFKNTYDRTYESSGVKLFQGIVHGGLTTGGIFQEFMAHSGNDRRATQNFMLGTLNLLMRAAALEMTYAEINNDPNHALKQSAWADRFTQVKNKMVALDNEIVRNYHTQMTRDVNDFATTHPKGGLSNTDFSSQLYSTLTKKFYWRDWFVVAAATYGTDKLISHACEYSQHDNHGRSIYIASVDKSKKVMDTHAASAATSGLHLYRSFVGHGDLQRHYVCVNAADGYNGLPDSARNHCNTYAAAGVYCTHNTDIHLHAPAARLHSYTAHGANRVYLFG